MTPNPPLSMPGPAGSADARSRLAGRRPSLPNSRAVLGGLLVAAAAVGTFAAWSSADDPPSSRFVVAARDLPVGEVIDETDLALAAMDVPAAVAERAFPRAAPVLGQRTVAPLAEGELIQRSAVVVAENAGKGRQISFAIDVADALAGTLEVGERVDLLVTYGGTANDSVTEVVAAGATVAALPLADDEVGGQAVVLLTLPEDADVLAVTNAVRQGSLTMIRSIGDPVTTGDRFQPELDRAAAQ